MFAVTAFRKAETGNISVRVHNESLSTFRRTFISQIAMETKSPTSSGLTRTGRVISLFVTLALAIPVSRWLMASPILEFLDQRSQYEHWQGSPTLVRLGEYRLEYFENLTIAQDEKVGNVTCVFCSVAVRGSVYDHVTALWGDVTVEDGGRVGQGIQVVGGGLTVLAGGHVPQPLFVQGGKAKIDASVQLNRSFMVDHSNVYYPGQRSFPASGVDLFIAVVALTVTCGVWLPTEAFRERVATAVRKPIWSVLAGIVLIAFLPILEAIAVVSMYIFRSPLMFPLFFYAPLALYWVLLTIGLASLSFQVGSLAGKSPLAKQVIGALVIVGAMLLPVVGFFAMAAAILVALGAGVCGLFRTRRGALSNRAHFLS
jgi:hypothetical protein